MRYGGQSDWLVGAGGAVAAASPVIEVTGPPRVWRVALQPLIRPDGQPVVAALADVPSAVLEIGAGPVASTVAVDWPFAGGVFDVVAGALRVSGRATPGAAISGGTASQAMRFRAWCAPTTGGGGRYATRTIVIGSIPTDQDSTNRDVPPGAVEVAVWAETDAGGGTLSPPQAYQIRWVSPSPLVGASRYQTALDTNQIANIPAGFAPFVGHDSMLVTSGQWSLVPPWASSFYVNNPPTPDGGNLLNVSVVFKIHL